MSRLLQSPHYGERWARHWLDLVRFGESNGFEYDEPRNNAWHYRNWVIDALNQDLPYDDFARQQIAGDAYHPNTFNASAALGFLVAGPHNTTLPSNDKMRMEMAQEELEDLVGTVCQTFLGLTAQCARCHEHKFDPISHKEYYQLAAALAGVSHGELKIKVPLPRPNNRDSNRLPFRSLIWNTKSKRDSLRPARRFASRDPKASIEPRIDSRGQPYASWEFEGNFDDSMGRLPARPFGNAESNQELLSWTAKMLSHNLILSRWPSPKKNAGSLGAAHQSRPTRWRRPVDPDARRCHSLMASFSVNESEDVDGCSNHFARTQSLHGSLESEADKRPVAMAIVYKKDGTIEAYRDGVPYGQAYKASSLQSYEPQKSHIVFGLRHAPLEAIACSQVASCGHSFYDRAVECRGDRSVRCVGRSFVRLSIVGNGTTIR